MPKGAYRKWEELGPFNLGAHLGARRIKFDKNREIVKEKNYIGQYNKVGIGRYYFGSSIYEGQMNGGCSGYGRRIFKDGSYYEGEFGFDN